MHQNDAGLQSRNRQNYSIESMASNVTPMEVKRPVAVDPRESPANDALQRGAWPDPTAARFVLVQNPHFRTLTVRSLMRRNPKNRAAGPGRPVSARFLMA
jgi:hypothetical protein